MLVLFRPSPSAYGESNKNVMKKKQTNKKPGKAKVLKSSKAGAKKKPVANNKKKNAVKTKPAKKAAAPASKSKPSKEKKKPEVKKPVKPVAKASAAKPEKEKKQAPPPAKEKKVAHGLPEKRINAPKDKKAMAAFLEEAKANSIDRPLNERPLSEKHKAPEGEKIKLRIDDRTIITVRSKEALKMWMQRYPNAVQED